MDCVIFDYWWGYNTWFRRFLVFRKKTLSKFVFRRGFEFVGKGGGGGLTENTNNLSHTEI